jgi:hypothetical protein
MLTMLTQTPALFERLFGLGNRMTACPQLCDEPLLARNHGDADGQVSVHAAPAHV